MSPPNEEQAILEPPDSGVTVRMYNPGYGDCLLLAFRAEDGSARYMLIDCGVHSSYPKKKEKMESVAEDIRKATQGNIDVVAITHEHYDHLSGFGYGRESFDGINIKDLWLAWTEDDDDEVTKKLKKDYGKKFKMAAAALNALRADDNPWSSTLQGLLEFDLPEKFGAALGNADQLKYLRQKSKKTLQSSQDYRQPGEAPLTIPGVEGVRIFVLGPPKDLNELEETEDETDLYFMFTGLNETSSFGVAALAAAGADYMDEEEKELFERSRPFDVSLRIPRDKAFDHPEYGDFFKKGYGSSEKKGHGEKWRRIDTDWLAWTLQVALKYSDMVNNTSLVLAIELTETEPRKVLLFVGDAQQGNWNSWHELEWQDEGPNGETVTVSDLLQRTVFYKVGHHGSHNATLREKGLEMMEAPSLVAMIPVDEEWALKRKPKAWEHPAKNLLDRLKEKAKGRIIRSDRIPTGDQPPEQPDEATHSEWQAFINQLDWDRGPNRLWIQFTVPG
jgi:beta-lactamase superfamily II metal-dependent hydrolase